VLNILKKIKFKNESYYEESEKDNDEIIDNFHIKLGWKKI
jgi:hypothetical protein